MRLMRSLLFAPANRHDLLKKFPSYPADGVAIDLEDGTPENEKAGARERLPDVTAYLRQQGLKASTHGRASYLLRGSAVFKPWIRFSRRSETTTDSAAMRKPAGNSA